MDIAAPTIIDEAMEHHRASYWRRRIVLLRIEQLAELTGYAKRTLWHLESGATVDPRTWRRYKLACAAVHAQLRGWDRGRKFEWRA